jgi:hypothetical protein
MNADKMLDGSNEIRAIFKPELDVELANVQWGGGRPPQDGTVVPVHIDSHFDR